MENISAYERNNAIDTIARTNFNGNLVSRERSGVNPVVENILSEGGENLFQYLKWTGLAKEQNLMVLSSIQHYYYDHNDLKGIKALINLKKLNQIRHLESFFHTLYRIMSYDASLVGSFKRNHHNGKSFYNSSRIIKRLMSILDLRTERNLSKEVVRTLLENNGFTVVDMTEISGITYFWAQNNRRL